MPWPTRGCCGIGKYIVVAEEIAQTIQLRATDCTVWGLKPVAARFSTSFQTGSEAHPTPAQQAPCTFPRNKMANPYIASGSCMCRAVLLAAIPLLLSVPVWHVLEQPLPYIYQLHSIIYYWCSDSTLSRPVIVILTTYLVQKVPQRAGQPSGARCAGH